MQPCTWCVDLGGEWCRSLPRMGNETEAGTRGPPGAKALRLKKLCAIRVLTLGGLPESRAGAGGQVRRRTRGGRESRRWGCLGGQKKRVSERPDVAA